MAKIIPTDAIIILHNRLSALSARDPMRRLIVAEAAEFYSVSHAKVYRALRQQHKPKTAHRADYNHPRAISSEEMRKYCELIAALKLRTNNKKNRHLSTKECIRLLENYGVETSKGLVTAPKGLLKSSTINRFLNRYGLDFPSLCIQPTVVHFQAEYSNECWHFDFSPSDFKHFSDDEKRSSTEGSKKLMLASVADDRSGVIYQEYHYVYGEDVITALKFLFNAMAPKKISHFPFQGIPKMIYTDNGPVAKSLLFQRVMDYLGLEVRTHMPDGRDGRRKTSRSKGKVERPFRTVKESLETLYHLHPPKNLLEANEWLRHYLVRYSQEKHRHENHSRLEDWKRHLPQEGFRAMCEWDRFAAMCREPETRKVGSDACINFNGVKYQLSNELAGLTVVLLWGLFDNELRVEHENQQFGPFYPASGPIPLGQYRPHTKSTREKRADHITELAKSISIPRSALDSPDTPTLQRLNESGLTEEVQASVPFTPQNGFETTAFKDAIEAKTAISRMLGYPLGRLLPEQLAAINAIVAETLDKQAVISQVKALFEIKLCVKHEGNA
jgi:hypothetical protein